MQTRAKVENERQKRIKVKQEHLLEQLQKEQDYTASLNTDKHEAEQSGDEHIEIFDTLIEDSYKRQKTVRDIDGKGKDKGEGKGSSGSAANENTQLDCDLDGQTPPM